jgi:2-hydroxy-3-oxopropionate reductase
MKPIIGFIGLGIMGRHMSAHLLKAGYELYAFDRNQYKIDELVTHGAKPATSSADTAARSDIVISMLPDSPDVEKVSLGSGGIIEAAREGLVYVDMSTISPATAVHVAEALAAKGVACLDAPVSGGETGAINASLSIMVGGPQDIFEDAYPVFEAMGKTITLCGDHGAGQILKACNQVQVAMNFIGIAEALVLGTKAGVDPQTIIKVLGGGYAQTRVMDVRGPRMIRGDFEPGFKSKFHLKDLNIVMQTAEEYQVPLPGTAVAQKLFSELVNSGRGELDHSAVIMILEEMAKTEARIKM